MSHDFDAEHNGQKGECNSLGGIMSYGKIVNGKQQYVNEWSSCSKSDFEHHYFLNNWGGSCLDIVPGKKIPQL